MAASLEQLFVRFRASRDPKPLAAIFDATAAELLLVAVHLVGDRAEAEDLVQATFVAIIENADRYDATRPLRPWLVGVLVNRAKLALRRRRRTAAEDVSGVDVPARDRDPSEVAHAEETARHVARALESMPSPYRQVLVLHLVHRLAGVQIAHALGRPPATVRTQLKRGLAMLREALPVALALPVAVIATEGRGLACVRTLVLERAATTTTAVGTGAGATLVAAAAGGMVMAKKLLVAAAAVAVGAISWFGIIRPDVGPPPEVGIVEPTAEPRRVTVERSTVASDTPADVREALDVPERSPTRTVVCGRVVGAWDGMPKRAERVTVTARPADWNTTSWTTSTGADGRFEVEVAFAPDQVWSLELGGSEFTDTSGRIMLGGTGRHDLGDIAVLRGTLLRARVVDESGAPVANVPFGIEYPLATLRSVTRARSGVRSDAAGLLELDRRLCEGQVELTAESGYTIVRGSRFRIDAGAEIAEPTVVVRELRDEESISGRVEDRRGRGIAGIRIISHPGLRDRGFTRKDGSFRVFKAAGEQESVTLDFVGTDEYVGRADVSPRFGVHDLRIVLDDAVTLPVRVVAADTGKPLESFAVHFGGTDDRMFHRHDLAKHMRTGTHEDGRVALTGVPVTGRLALIVLPDDEAYAMSPRVTVDLPWRSREPLEVRLPRRVPVGVRVVDGDREPVPGAVVQLVQTNPGDDVTAADFTFMSAKQAWGRLNPAFDLRWPAPFVIDEAATGADGLARLTSSLPSTDVAVVVTGEGLLPVRSGPVELGREPLEVVVRSGAGVRGRVGPAAVLERFSYMPADESTRVFVGLRRPGEEFLRLGKSSDAQPIDADAAFELSGLEPGRWELVLLWRRCRSSSRHGSSWQEIACEPPLSTVDLDPGTPLDVGELDLTPHVPAAIRGRTFHEGVPVAHATVSLTRRHVDASGSEREEAGLGAIPTDAAGRFVVGGLLPGTYTLHVEQLDAAGGRRTMQSDEFVLARGAELERVFDLH